MLALFALVAAACGDDDTTDTSDGDTTVEEPSDDPAEEPADEPSDDPAEEPADDPAEEPADDPAEEPVLGGSINYVSQIGPPRGLDPAKALQGVIDAQYQMLVFGSMVYGNATGELIPGLAESVVPNGDFTQWTITLRDGLMFTDGTEFTVDAIVAHWDRIADPATGARAAADIAEVESTEVVDPLTLVVNLNRPDGTWAEVLSQSPGWIPSPAVVEQCGDAFGTTPECTVGAGPFVVTEIVAGDHWTYEKNPDYYDAPKPYLDEVVMRSVVDPRTRTDTFLSGAADFFNVLTPHVVLAEVEGYPVATSWNQGIPSLALRTDEGPTSDIRVRRALNMAIDREAVIARASPGASDLEGIMDPAGPWANDVTWIAYDPDQAQTLIDEYLADTGESSVDIELIGATGNSALWQAMKQEWDKIDGLNVTLALEESAQTSARIATRDYTGMLNTSIPNVPRGIVAALTSDSPQNLTFINNAGLDQAIIDANATDDPAVQAEAMRRVAEILVEEAPYVPQYVNPFRFFYHENIHGVEVMPESGAIIFENVWKD